jgi:hypothetical protein
MTAQTIIFTGLNLKSEVRNPKEVRSPKSKPHQPVWRQCPVTPIAFLLLAIALTGCQSGKFSNYISPRVTGRVLAADTQQPLAKATVRRVVPMRTAGADTPPKGSQLLMQPAGVRTDADGRFVLDAERVVAVFRRGGWYSVTVSFERSGYGSFQTNFSAAKFKQRSAEGVPLVNAGDILLKPKSQ